MKSNTEQGPVMWDLVNHDKNVLPKKLSGLVTIWQCPDVMHLGYFCDIPAKNVQPESSEEMSDKAKLGDILENK